MLAAPETRLCDTPGCDALARHSCPLCHVDACNACAHKSGYLLDLRRLPIETQESRGAVSLYFCPRCSVDTNANQAFREIIVKGLGRARELLIQDLQAEWSKLALSRQRG